MRGPLVVVLLVIMVFETLLAWVVRVRCRLVTSGIPRRVAISKKSDMIDMMSSRALTDSRSLSVQVPPISQIKK